jgi:hypothetical protein
MATRASRKRESTLWQLPHQIQSFGNRLPNNLSIPSVRPVSLKRIMTASTRQWRRVVPVPPLVGLDSPLTPPPPLTSFTGCRSRIMASLTSFLSRRQTDWTTLTFGSCVFMLKQPSPNLFRGNLLATSPGESKLKNSLHATASNNHSDRRRYSKHTRLRARRSHAIGELLLEIAGRSLPTKVFASS